MPYAETATGARLHYMERNRDGARLPVVCLHGLLGTGEMHFGHVMDWLEAQDYPVIAPSLRGYGDSTPKPRDFPYRFYERDARDVLAFLATLNIDRCHLLGYSDGGEVALICAGTEPDRFESVAVIGATGYIGANARPRIMNYRPGSQWITQEEIDLHQIADADRFSAQWRRSMITLIDAGGDIAVSLAPAMTARVLIMLGETDGLNPRVNAEHFLQNVPNGTLTMFACGHAVHDEQTEAFYQVFGEHLRAE